MTVPIGNGSRATTYTYGEQLFAAMLAAIESARERILFETYIIKSDAMGRRFKDALVAAAERGVDVYVIYDGFANLVVNPRFLRFPKTVHVLRFPVIRFTVRFLSPRAWGRDHRKILAVDDRVAFVGGYNVGSLYATDWRDTHLRIEGDAVWELVNAFVDFWNVHGPGPRLADEGAPTWDPSVRAHRNVPSQLTYPIRAMYLEAIDRREFGHPADRGVFPAGSGHPRRAHRGRPSWRSGPAAAPADQQPRGDRLAGARILQRVAGRRRPHSPLQRVDGAREDHDHRRRLVECRHGEHRPAEPDRQLRDQPRGARARTGQPT